MATSYRIALRTHVLSDTRPTRKDTSLTRSAVTKLTRDLHACFQRARSSRTVRQELGLALRSDRCDTNRQIGSSRPLAAVPLDRRADRVGRGPEGQSDW